MNKKSNSAPIPGRGGSWAAPLFLNTSNTTWDIIVFL